MQRGLVSTEAPKDKSVEKTRMAEELSVQTGERGKGILGQEKGTGTNEGSQQKLILTPQKGNFPLKQDCQDSE